MITITIKFVYRHRKKVYSYFNAYNSLVSGYKRTGKDLTIQNYIQLKFKKDYEKNNKKINKLINKNKYEQIHQHLSDIYKKYDLSYKNKKIKIKSIS